MLEAARDIVPIVALVVLLAVAYRHPPEWVEATAAAGCAGAALATGRLGPSELREEVERLLPVVLFLMAILVVAECCRAAGLFAAIGSRLAAVGSHHRIFVLAFGVAAATTVALSLDATVVLLTPVVLAAAHATRVSSRPLQLVCVRLANSASLLLPVSNLTNLLAMPHLDISFGRFALLMAPVWVVALGVEYAVHRLWFRAELRPSDDVVLPPDPVRLPVLPLATVAVMLVGFAVGSAYGIEPAWIAAGAAAFLAADTVRHRRAPARRLLHSTHASFALFVLGLGVVVATLAAGPLGGHLGSLLPSGTGLAALLGTALVGAVLANVVNNLPATLLLVPLAAVSGLEPALAALIGINLGSSMTWTGSLANLLWRRAVLRSGGTVDGRDFHGVALAATPVAIVLGVAVLHLWTGVV